MNNKNGLLTKIAAGLIFTLIVGAWSILYVRIESVAAIQLAMAERLRAVEIVYESVQRDLAKIDIHLERIERKIENQKK